MHRLMGALHETLPHHPDEKDAADSAVEAFALRRGRARDFAHVFIACARWRGIPARFIAGYRVGDQKGEAGAPEWGGAYLPGFRWVGVEATGPRRPHDRSCRVAVGVDCQEAAMSPTAPRGGQ